MRAAPGKLLELIDLIKSRMSALDAAGDGRPLWWRHMEGDQWELMLLFPVRPWACIAWQEDVFVMGPPLETVKKEFDGAGFYHVEMFIALPGKPAELTKERGMESAYQAAIGRPATMTFVRDQGAAWDVFSLGCYRDLRHWASTNDVPKETREAPARRAGFSGASAIGPYVRSLIDFHRDTIGSAIK